MNWTGHVVSAARSDLASLLKREEPNRTGVYVLLGDLAETDVALKRAVYIGEGDDISRRLRQHARPGEQGGKDFWDRVLIFTSKDANLTKAHARYLEARLIDSAQKAGRAYIVNTQAPDNTLLPEADIADMEYFLSQIFIVAPVMGVHEFRKPTTESSKTDTATSPGQASAGENLSPVFDFRLSKLAIAARAQEADGEFTVLAGSEARSSWLQDGKMTGYRPLYESLFEEGSLVRNSEQNKATFVRDVAFSSPSAAAAIVAGRAANGRKAWRTKTGETFGDWQNRGLDALPIE